MLGECVHGDAALRDRSNRAPPEGAVEVSAMITHEAVAGFVGAMYVRAIGSEQAFAWLDDMIDEQGTDEILSVRLDRDGHIRSVAMES